MDKSRIIFLVTSIFFALTTIVGLIGYLTTSSEIERYERESDVIVNEAVNEAKLEQKEEDARHFFEESKKPYAEYNGPADFGSIRFSYPNTWSVHNNKFDQNGYQIVFHPGVIPVISDNTALALRVSVINKQYETVVSEYETFVVQGQLRATVINVAQTESFSGYEGIKLEGAINEVLAEGTIIILKLRDKTIQIQTDATDWINDYNEIILPTFRYSE